MTHQESSPLNSVIQSLSVDPLCNSNIVYLRQTEPRPSHLVNLPDDIHPALANHLRQTGIHFLYSHQAQAFSLYKHHKNFVISTGTSSGKSLCYQLPILNSLCSETGSTALLLFPTKALTNDQLNGLHSLIPSEMSGLVRAAIYDGDTPQKDRAAIRNTANVLLTNPDMLHIGILPHHPSWARFFENLKIVVIDEIHIYRGIFGSHVANLMRRLQRIARFYNSDPVFVLTSATIHNPAQLASKLIEQDVAIIDEDGSPQGQKYFMIYNPPLINEELGVREGLLSTSGKLISILYQKNIQMLVFCRTRRFVELLLREVRKIMQIPQERIRGYRSGYLKSERREIENGLKNGLIRIGVATNALELGVDIGGVDAVLLPGYPGTISALTQRAGRAGRKFNPSLAVFIASMNPLDQFLARNPQYLLSRNPEEALINPDNPLILIEHLQCAAAELPIQKEDQFGSLKNNKVQEYLDYLVDSGTLYKKNGQFFWISDDYPTQHVSLRSTASTSILLKTTIEGEAKVIGEVDYNSGLWMVHPGAIYIHDGETYRVEELDLEKNVASLITFDGDYLTEPVVTADVEVLNLARSAEFNNYTLNHGDVLVKSRVTGYKRVKWSTREVIDFVDLDLPQTELRTVGFWIVLKKECIELMRESGMWRSDRNNYGPDWEKLRKRVRQRDRFTCQVCGKNETLEEHHVHHKIPFKSFISPEKANMLNNLVTLCKECHSLVESQVRVRSALSGLNNLLGSLAPLMVMSDAGDLGNFFDPVAKFADNQPAIIFYDHVPGGIGLAYHLYECFQELLSNVAEVASHCECSDGCPSCVGPALDSSSGGKMETQQLIKYLQE